MNEWTNEWMNEWRKKRKRILTKVFCTYGQNLVILAWTGDELSHGQTYWRTDGRSNDNNRGPKLVSGKNGLTLIPI